MNELMTMGLNSLMPFASIIIVVLTVLFVMMLIAAKRSHFMTATVSVIGLNAALIVLMMQILGYYAIPAEIAVDPMFVVDSFAQFNMVVILVSSLACFTLSYAYFESFKDKKEELYLLMLLSTIGAMLMVCAHNLASFFISLELLSVPLYGMLAYAFMRNQSLESGLKYLVLSATASATLLMGMAFVYAEVGTLDFKEISVAMRYVLESPLMILGAAMMLFAIAFKLSAAPFHTWTPDVYEGAPAPVAAYLASVSKVAMMGLAIRFLTDSAALALESIQLLIMVIATLSILIGNLLAIRQTNLKRLLGYSSIAHMGYVLVVIASIGIASAEVVSNMYMAMYALTSIGCFGVITLMSSPYQDAGEADKLSYYQGLFWRRPVMTGMMTIMLLSLAGIPLTAGFITKFFAVLSAVQGMQWFLAAMIVVGSAIGLYYYLRVLLTMYKRPHGNIKFDAMPHWGAQVGGIMIMIVTLVVIYFGVLPNDLIIWSEQARIW